ncbi:hypothetical protein KAH94_06635, partial [bacterium]|nr:hypothetical protein [bacterium]
GEVATVVGDIAGEELEKMGGIADTAATKIANIAAEWENFKKDLSQDEGFANALKSQLDDVQRETAFFFSDDISNWEKWSTFIKGIFSEDAYERGLEAFEKAQKKLENFNRTFEDEDSNEYRNRIAGLTDTIETQITTYGGLKTQIKETTALLDMADITDTNYIKTLGKEIQALEKKKKAFEDLAKPVTRVTTPELMAADRGTENLSVSLSEEELKAFDQANKSLDSMNEFIQTNIDEVAEMNDGWESYIDTMIRVAQQHDLLQGGLTRLQIAGLAFTEGLMQSAQSADLNLKNLGQTIKSVVGDSIRAFIAEGVAGAVSTAIAKSGIPFPFNMAAGAIAAAGAVALFNSIIPGFEAGGVIPGTQLTGDRKLIRANSGEEVLRRDDPRHRYNNSSRMAANNVRPIILQPSIEYTARGFKVMLNEVDYADSRRRG